jgi:pSer/pThr/pTyr-binding forkhead associated (FHA) protein
MSKDLDIIPQNAAFHFESGRTVPLVKLVISIGRQLENQLVLDDPRVSRDHAQLRAVKGEYVLSDLNSSSGTFVNGKRITQCVLYPNDVVSIGGIELTYTQDTSLTRRDLTDTITL